MMVYTSETRDGPPDGPRSREGEREAAIQHTPNVGQRPVLFLSPHDVRPPLSGTERRIRALTHEISKAQGGHLLYPVEKEPNGPGACVLEGLVNHPLRLVHRLEKVAPTRMLLKALQIHRREGFACIFCHTFIPGFQAVLLKLITHRPLLLDEHNVEHLRYRSVGNRLWKLVRIYEAMVCRHADVVFCVSAENQQSIMDLVGGRSRVVVAKNGFDAAVFRPDPSGAERARKSLGPVPGKTVLFFGNYRYKPNDQARRIIEREIAPRVAQHLPTIRFLLAGRGPPYKGEKGHVIFLGEVERIEDFTNFADLVICPLVSGGGTRLKIVESIACGRTVISTTLGAEGLVDETTKGRLVLADDWDDFARAVVRLLNSPLPVRVPEGFMEEYSWTHVVSRAVLPLVRGCTLEGCAARGSEHPP